MSAPQSFTIRYEGHVNRLLTNCFIFTPRQNQKPYTKEDTKEYKGLWDTGATATVICQKCVSELGLQPIGRTQVNSVTGISYSEVYMVSVGLPNKLIIENLRVTVGNFPDFDSLIEMDIICLGDFSISHVNKKTTFTYRFPSISEIDFVGKTVPPTPAKSEKVGRNQPCPCGSGRKYKYCCGRRG